VEQSAVTLGRFGLCAASFWVFGSWLLLVFASCPGTWFFLGGFCAGPILGAFFFTSFLSWALAWASLIVSGVVFDKFSGYHDCFYSLEHNSCIGWRRDEERWILGALQTKGEGLENVLNHNWHMEHLRVMWKGDKWFS